MSITEFPRGTKAQQARSADIHAIVNQIADDRRRYHMRVTAGGVSEDRYVSERSKDFLLRMGQQYGDWATIEVIGTTGAAREPVSMAAFRARRKRGGVS